ncbi:hypothetical protein [Novosphingobium mathurense]|uniref:Uncharacterized protein n=1 Tax=Novosphingobium mathurense TaxID=428990 RepID=A0A1U6IET9_9SPHN|nr:hypothetical protein [Novosphingobium mathurense]SLK06535.1 hypothetical protein SAMN06295987_1065 [Novosphingobium mathurense]
MTKVRDPLTFAAAIKGVLEYIGKREASRVTRRAGRTLDHWSDSTNKGLPALDKAVALDRAYLAAGGGYAPILESYIRQLDVSLVELIACRAALADDVANVSREIGEAISFCIMAAQPGASPAVIQRAIVETEEADALLPRLLGRLKSFMPGNGAARETMGNHR